MRVNIVVTGVAEQKGIVTFLENTFNDVEFHAVRFDGFTSVRLSPDATVPTAGNVPSDVAELANFFVETVNSRGGEQFILLEDLEVANLDQPGVVIQCFLNAVNAIIDAKRPHHGSTENNLRERAAFHLLSPMLESYFFADENILGSLELQSTPLLANGDVEGFRVNDPDFLRSISQLAPISNGGKIWQPTQWYASHPKHYLKYLRTPCSPYDPEIPNYKESTVGTQALKSLDHKTVLSDSTAVQFFRAFLSDLAWQIKQENKIEHGICHPLTSGQGTTLRNI